jgi:phosphoribosylaminoimidazole-succinocarboxamide synthase
MPDEFVWTVSNRYIELYERITGKTFEKANTDDILQRIETNVASWLK